MITPTVPTREARLSPGFRISGETRTDWDNLVPAQWFRPDLRDSVPPILHLPNGETTISPVRMCLNVLAGYDELDAHCRWLWEQGFWTTEQYVSSLMEHEAGRSAVRVALVTAYEWEAAR